MAVDHRFHVLGMNLLTTDIDGAAAPADEIKAIVAQFDYIAGIDEAFRVGNTVALTAEVTARNPTRPNSQRTVFDLPLDISAVLPNHPGWKACETVIDIESQAGLGRGEGVADLRFRVKGEQVIEYRLIGDFSRQTDIVGRNSARHRTHKNTTPMRWGSRNPHDAVRARSDQEIVQRFTGVRKYERSMIQKSAQKNLQAAVTTNIVKRTPYDRNSRRLASLDRPHQTRQRMANQLGKAARAGRKEYPVGFPAFSLFVRISNDAGSANKAFDAARFGFRRRTVGYYRVHAGGFHDR